MWGISGEMKKVKITLVEVIMIAIIGLTLVGLALQPVNESRVYNKLTGAETTWWDAIWVELRVENPTRNYQQIQTDKSEF